MLIAEDENKMLGFIIERIIEAPEVYDLKGLTLMIDDFCVETENDWSLIGGQLIEKIKPKAKSKGASQILVVCGVHDEPKRQFLKALGLLGLNVASEWYNAAI